MGADNLADSITQGSWAAPPPPMDPANPTRDPADAATKKATMDNLDEQRRKQGRASTYLTGGDTGAASTFSQSLLGN